MEETMIAEVEGDLSGLGYEYKDHYEPGPKDHYKHLAEYVYKRDKYGNKDKTRPVGCLFAYRDEDDTVRLGWSAYNFIGELFAGNRFNKDQASDIAVRRAIKGRFYYTEDVPYSLHKELPRFLDRCHKYFKEFPVNIENPGSTGIAS